MLLRDKVAVVTGSANGIGHAIARLFAENSCRLLLLDRDAENNQRTAMELRSAGVRVLDLALDLRDRPAIEAAVRAAHDQLGPLDILVNNAGICPRRSFLEISQQQWNEVQSTNLSSMFHMTQVMLPDMISRRSGKVINISSVTFHQGVAGFAHYVASKGGMIGLTRAITSLSVKRTARGECPLKTQDEAVSRIHKMTPQRTYAEIAAALNRAGLRSAFGRRFTGQHVGYICRRDGLAGRKPHSTSKLHNTPEAGGPSES